MHQNMEHEAQQTRGAKAASEATDDRAHVSNARSPFSYHFFTCLPGRYYDSRVPRHVQRWLSDRSTRCILYMRSSPLLHVYLIIELVAICTS